MDFFERRGEKQRRWNTADVPFFSFSDGVLCFRLVFFVIFLALFLYLQVWVCAYYGYYGRIDIFSHEIIFSWMVKDTGYKIPQT